LQVLHACKPRFKNPLAYRCIPTAGKIVFLGVKPPPAGLPAAASEENRYEFSGLADRSVKRQALRLPTSPCPLGRRTWTSFLDTEENFLNGGFSLWLAFSAAGRLAAGFFFGDCALPMEMSICFRPPNNDCANVVF